MFQELFKPVLLGQWNGLPNGVFDLDTDTLKVSAHTVAYTPNLDADDFWDDTTNEVTGGGYTTGGLTLTGVTVVLAAGTVTFDADDFVWQRSATGFTNARKFVIYRSTGTPATSRLFSLITSGIDLSNAACDLVISAGAPGPAVIPMWGDGVTYWGDGVTRWG